MSDISSGVTCPSAKQAKKELRNHIKGLLAQFTEEQLHEASCNITERILCHPKVCAATTILLYHSMPDEVCTHTLIQTLFQQGKTILLPKVISDTQMTIHPYHGNNSLSVGAYGILEPNTPAINSHELNEDIITPVALVPGIAFDAKGNRLGRGKGYYDRLLKTIPTYNIGICFPFQLVDSIPVGRYDVIMDEVIH